MHCILLFFMIRNVIQSVSISTGNLVGSYRGHKDLVSAMVTLTGANGELLIASGSIDGQINVWNPVSFVLVLLFVAFVTDRDHSL